MLMYDYYEHSHIQFKNVFGFEKKVQSYAHIECNVQIKSKFTKVLDDIIRISTVCTVRSKQIEIVDNNSNTEFTYIVSFKQLKPYFVLGLSRIIVSRLLHNLVMFALYP